MARPLRIEFPGAVYHVTARGNARADIFTEDSDRQIFLSVLGQTVKRFNWLCHAYCLMGNHYPLLIETPEILGRVESRLWKSGYIREALQRAACSAIHVREVWV